MFAIPGSYYKITWPNTHVKELEETSNVFQLLVGQYRKTDKESPLKYD